MLDFAIRFHFQDEQLLSTACNCYILEAFLAARIIYNLHKRNFGAEAQYFVKRYLFAKQLASSTLDLGPASTLSCGMEISIANIVS